MRRILLSALLFAATAVYAQTSPQSIVLAQTTNQPAVFAPTSPQSAALRSGSRTQLSPVADGLFRNAPAKKSGASLLPVNIIYNEPEGTAHERLLRKGFRFQNTSSGVTADSYDYAVGRYVEGDDGNLYLYEPFNSLATQSWLRLEKVDDEHYVAHTPQPIYQNNGTTYYATWMKMARLDGHTYGFIPDTINGKPDYDMKFTLRDGMLSVDDDEHFEDTRYPLHLLCLADANNQWTGYGEGLTRIEPMNETATQLPQGVEPQDYALETTTMNSVTQEVTSVRTMTKAAFDGNDVYLLNPGDSLSWIKGTIEDGKAVFHRQYAGADEAQSLQLWFFPATYGIVNDSSMIDYGVVFHIRDYHEANQIAFDYDTANGTLTAVTGTSMLINARPDYIYYLHNYDDPQYRRFTEKEATPVEPVIMDAWGYDPNAKCGQIQFKLLPKSTEGDDLNSDKLYYSFYVDDDTEPFVFSTDTYYGLTEDLTEVPYNFSDNYDFFSTNDIKSFFYYFDEQEHDRLGLQSVYRGNDIEHRSDIVWIDTSTLGISIPSANDKQGTAEYYDLSGRRLTQPQHGITIVRQNGQVRKIIRR